MASNYKSSKKKSSVQKQIQALLQQGMTHHQKGDFTKARTYYQKILQLHPQHAQVLHLLGVVAYQTQHYDIAVEYITQAIAQNKTTAAFFGNLGHALAAQGKVTEATTAYREALRLKPDFIEVYGYLGHLLKQQGAWQAASSCYRQILTYQPHHAVALNNLANLLQAQQQLEEAATYYQKALQIQPDYWEARNNLAVLLQKQGQWQAAIDCYQVLLTYNPNIAEIHNNLGTLLQKQSQWQAALQCFQTALSLKPTYPEAYHNLGTVLQQQGQYDEALRCFQQALTLNPDYPEAYSSLAGVLYDQARFEEAIHYFQKALTYRPAEAEIYNSLGVALQARGQWEAALQHFQKALQLDPQHDNAHFNCALLSLSTCHLAKGWSEYQYRPDRIQSSAFLRQPLPTVLTGQRLLLYKEQGLGDELFFLRFIDQLKIQGVTWLGYRASAKISPLLQRHALFDQIITDETIQPPVDIALLVGDLPYLCQANDCQQLPPPLTLFTQPEQLTHLRAQLSRLGDPPYVGITWRAGLKPEEGTHKKKLLRKEIALPALAQALYPVKATFISLQRQPAPEETATLSNLLKRPVHDFSALNENLEEMLALLALLDNYVGVSNTNMHLIAGLGKAARVLVPYPPEWRWCLTGSTSPWFPHFKVYRQTIEGVWPLEALTLDLIHQLNDESRE